LLGACTQASCIYGGVTNISACMGTASESDKPCENLLINKDRRSILINLITDFESQIGQSPPDSPMRQSLVGNHKAAKEAINVIDQSHDHDNESC
jgi:hypothetical protein